MIAMKLWRKDIKIPQTSSEIATAYLYLCDVQNFQSLNISGNEHS